MELVDIADLKSAERETNHAGSSPAAGTKNFIINSIEILGFICIFTLKILRIQTL